MTKADKYVTKKMRLKKQRMKNSEIHFLKTNKRRERKYYLRKNVIKESDNGIIHKD